MHLLNNSNILIENAIKLDSNIYKINLKMMQSCNKYGMHHTPTVISFARFEQNLNANLSNEHHTNQST